ncbi:hypothetical protein MKW94_007109, partial [Papaver nudicaule]|nr:hypothetical protein [Papaver nudicaule]
NDDTALLQQALTMSLNESTPSGGISLEDTYRSEATKEDQELALDGLKYEHRTCKGCSCEPPFVKFVGFHLLKISAKTYQFIVFSWILRIGTQLSDFIR